MPEFGEIKQNLKDNATAAKEGSSNFAKGFYQHAQRWLYLSQAPVMVSLSSAAVCVVTNPIDLVKVRFQLQGELKHKAAYDVKYRNVFSSLYKIGDVEGVRSLQKGLVPAIAYQIIYNWFRSIMYIKADERGTMRDANDNPVLWKRAAMATFGGVVGCVAASPFYMAKIQLQSRAGHSATAVGYQHIHTRMRWALWALPRCHYGYLAGTFQGCKSASLRIAVATFAQMYSFIYIHQFVQWLGISDDNAKNAIIASIITCAPVTLIMNPFDVVSTRMYNQETKLYYSDIADCFKKILEREGLYGFYKGSVAQYLRLAPHTILTLMCWEYLTRKGIELRAQELDGVSRIMPESELKPVTIWERAEDRWKQVKKALRDSNK